MYTSCTCERRSIKKLLKEVTVSYSFLEPKNQTELVRKQYHKGFKDLWEYGVYLFPMQAHSGCKGSNSV